MNKTLLYLAIAGLSFPAQAFPGKEKPQIQSRTAVIGYTAQNQQVVAKVCEFPEYIYRFSLDPDQHHAMIVLRDSRNGKYTNSGHLTVFDINTGQLAWSLGIRRFNIDRTKNLIYYGSDNASRYFNITDGERVSYAAPNTVFRDYDHDIGIVGNGYGVNLYTNKSLWKHPLGGTNISSLKYLNDTTVLIILEGLHLVNIKTGTGWDYTMKTSKKIYGWSLL